MKKVLNWTIGSFFRTIGRTIAFLVMGGLIYYLLTYNGIGIEDLFFEKVNASTYQNSDWYTYYDSQNNVLPSYYEYQYMTNNVTTTNGDYTGSLFVLYNQTKDLTPLKGGKIVIPFFIETPTIYNTGHSTIYGSDMCTRFQCTQWDTSNNNCLRYTCDYTSASQDSTIDDKEPIPAHVDIYAILVYTNGYAESCSFSRDTMSISCNVSNNTLVGVVQDIRVFHKVYYSNATLTSTYKFGLGSRVQYFSDSTTTIIDNQQQQIQQDQQQHQEMMDSNTTEAEEEATSFFEDFDVPDVGGLSAIITAPLNTIRSLLNSSCTNLTLPLPYVNKNIVLPCMNSIYTEHFGAFFTIYQTIILAIIAYRCIRSIYFDIHGFTNPDDDRIEVMDL